MRTRLVLVCLLLGWSGVGCGLRSEPLLPDGGRGPGVGGSAAGGSGGSAGGGGKDAGIDRGSADTGPEAPTCTAGSACVPANSCHVGATTCGANGVASCMDTQQAQANGTVCGQDKVCNNGSCATCAAGSACSVTAKPCRTGTITCTTGAPVCTETDNQPNGMSCGTGMVCQAGQCTPCQDGATCTPTNACHLGALSCATGTPQCTDKGTLLAAGTTCGTDKVCSAAGACGACKVGASCAVTSKPCRTGTTTCNTGVAVCAESGNTADGTNCGTNLVCSAGACVSCTAGLACTPMNPCHAGFTACSPAITCADSGNALVNGTVCGTNKVCSSGTCAACTAGASCQPTNLCRTGATSCVTGASVCAETGNRPNGTACGTNQVCNNGGCVACSAGGVCTPSNPCHNGTLTCSTGTAVCTDSGAMVADGKNCGMNLVCKTGSCVSCTAGVTCTPSNPCKNGTTSCATGASVCTASSNKPVGTLCGAAQSCANGVKTSAAMCDASQVCQTATTTCPSACNAAGTDCNACLAGQTMCSDGCQTLSSDPANCGTCGHVCPNPPVVGSGSATCSSGPGCGVSCNTGYLQCGGGGSSSSYCQIQSWGFEDSNGTSTDGFSIIGSDQMAVTSISPSTSVAHSGTYALAVAVTVQGAARGFEVGLTMCGGSGYVPSNGQTVSAWFYLSPDSAGVPPPNPSSSFGERLYTNGNNGGNTTMTATVGTWFQVSTPIESVGTQLQKLALVGRFETDGTTDSDWSGTVYIDDIVIQ